MIKKILYLTVIGSLLLFFVASAANINQASPEHKSKTAPMKKSVPLTGNEPLPNVPYAPIHYRLAASSPGDTVGWTQYDFQSNGSSGNRVALNSFGGVSFAWMNAPAIYVVRKIYYNYYSSGGGWTWPGIGNEAGFHPNGDGYCQLSLFSDDRAAVAYHKAPEGAESTFVAINDAPDQGSFTQYFPTIRFGAEHCIWPYLTVDRNDRIHVTASETTPTAYDEQTTGYIRSTNGGTSWTTPSVIDTLTDISTVVVSSPVSDKVAIVYTHPYDTSSQWYNDLYYIESTNGTTWDFRNGKHNITEYANDSDSLWAYTDCDAVYDFNDNLHIIWNAQYLDTVSNGIYFSASLFHYSTGTGTISEITQFDSTWATSGCDFGSWNWSIAKMSIGVDNLNNGSLFVTYTSWNIGDCSAGGYANGDIFMQYSTDNGVNWTLRGDLTNSQTPLCEAGDCDSDNWSSLAEHVDGNLHLFYVNDKDAGGVVHTEGATTDNPMLYYAYPNPIRTSAVPVAPALVFPYNDSSYSSGFFLFDWTDPVVAISYTVQVDDEVGFGTPIITEAGLTRSEYINTDSLELGTYYWRVKSVGYYGESDYSAPFTFEVIPGCAYITGDVNNSGTFNGIDVTFGVGYFKGGNPPPYSCDCNGSTWFVAGDVNGNCSFNGIDITYMVTYFKGGNTPIACPSCPPPAR